MSINWREVDAAREIIKIKRLPLRNEDAVAFSTAFLGDHLTVLRSHLTTSGHLSALLEAFQFDDKNAFDQKMDRMAQSVKASIGKDAYHLLVLKEKGSDRWVYEQLLERGVREADSIVTLYENDHLARNPQDTIPQGARVLIVDDHAISGGQIKDDMLMTSPKGFFRLSGFFGSITTHAENVIRSAGLEDINTFGHIKSLQESLPKAVWQDLWFIDLYDRMGTHYSRSIAPHHAAYWHYGKIPDSFPEIFIGRRLSTLLRPGDFPPPYNPTNLYRTAYESYIDNLGPWDL